MNIDVHHHHHFPPAPADPKQDQIIALLHALKHQQETTMATLQEALAADEAAEAKIVGLLQTQAQGLKDLAQQLADAIANGSNGPDQAAVQAVADQMMADAATMEAAVSAASPPAQTDPQDPTQQPTDSSSNT